MKILLLNMPVSLNAWQNLEMPLGVAYIASVLEQNGHQVFIRDYEVEDFSEAEFKGYISGIAPDMAGVSFRSASYHSAKKICNLIKSIDSGIRIVLGGHHATAFPEDTLKSMPADFIVRGEGEYVLPRLLNALLSNSDLGDIPNIVYRNNGQIIKTASVEAPDDLDKVPFPAWHLLPMEKYVTGSILSSRGCPFSCIYCDKGISTSNVKFRSPDNIIREIIAFEEKYKKGRLYFVDDNFLLNKERVTELFNLMKQAQLRIKWSCQARVDAVDSQMLGLAKDTGCETIIYGIETGDEEELRYINKKTTLKQAENKLRLTKEAGIKARANFMLGFPISTHDSIRNSIRFAAKLNADLYRFFVVSPLPNTILWDRVFGQGSDISKVSWENFDFYSPAFDTKELKKEEVFVYVGAAYLYVLKKNFIREISYKLIPNLFKLLKLTSKNARLRGNLSKAFPASVNLLLEEWFIIRRMHWGARIDYIRKILSLERKIRMTKNVNTPLKVLYITYLGLLEPIPQSQVIPYLLRLSEASSIEVLSFEKKEIIKSSAEKFAKLQASLKESGIKWYILKYHKRPLFFSSVYDILSGFIVSLYLVIFSRINIIHARSNVPIAIAFLVKILSGVKIIYDRRGIMGEDHLEHSGWKKGGLLYRFSIWFERLVMNNSEAIVVLTRQMNDYLKDNVFAGKKRRPLIETIPCCASLQPPGQDRSQTSESLKQKLNLSGKFVFVYSGSVATYNMVDEMLDFFKSALALMPNSHFLILSHTPEPVLNAIEKKGLDRNSITVIFSERESLADYLSLGDVGLIFRRPSVTALAASPIKFSEYLACGLPVISTHQIGDLPAIINQNKIGVVLEGLDEDGYNDAVNKLFALLAERDKIQTRCRQVAREFFSLEQGVNNYLNIYNQLSKL